MIGESGKFGFLNGKLRYFEASSVIFNKPFSSNCQIAIAVNNLEIEAVLYFVNSFDVLFSVPSLFNLDVPKDLQNIVSLLFMTAKPPANKGDSGLFIIDWILFTISSYSNFKLFSEEIIYGNKNNNDNNIKFVFIILINTIF